MPPDLPRFLDEALSLRGVDGFRRLETGARSNRIAPLAPGAADYAYVTCTNANADYALADPIPAGTGYLVLQASADCLVAVGEATTTSVGLPIGAGTITYPVVFAEGDRVHVRSATAGCTLVVGYQPLE